LFDANREGKTFKMKTILQSHVPHNTGWSAEMKRGQIIRISATTTVDFVFFQTGQSN
jgi:hypothetical protein